jgi:stearoyl-CoA desaturase (delta-9 desaturase)
MTTTTTGIPGVQYGGWPVLRKRIDNFLLIGIPFVGSVAAIVHIARHGVTLVDLASFLLFFVAVGIGVSLGLHRLFSHKSFEPHPVVAYILGALGTMAFQGSIFRWVADHRRHHAHTDTEGDVHSPHADPWGAHIDGWRGFLHAHIGWMFDGTATDPDFYGKGLMKDPVIAFFTRYHVPFLALSFALPYGFGYLFGGHEAGWSSLLIGGCLRTTLLHNVIWSVNSFGHTMGERNFERGNKSTNSLILALLTLGDGWHNNHHEFPRSYRQGLYKGEIDINARIIEGLEKVGLARNLIDNSGVPHAFPKAVRSRSGFPNQQP